MSQWSVTFLHSHNSYRCKYCNITNDTQIIKGILSNDKMHHLSFEQYYNKKYYNVKSIAYKQITEIIWILHLRFVLYHLFMFSVIINNFKKEYRTDLGYTMKIRTLNISSFLGQHNLENEFLFSPTLKCWNHRYCIVCICFHILSDYDYMHGIQSCIV